MLVTVTIVIADLLLAFLLASVVLLLWTHNALACPRASRSIRLPAGPIFETMLKHVLVPRVLAFFTR
jgi:hypothetical protein